ncbi:MAG TPA: dynamin family protein [candidate division Zixibacteria bacterium]|nr:dynamin family protein [candidate division Zixibacteria bacterium]
MERLRRLCEGLGKAGSQPLARIAELQQRLAEERFHLAVLGQFKRGKSTLLNALLGEPLLPTGVVPLTSVPTFLQGGERRAIRVLFRDRGQAAFTDLTLEDAHEILVRHVTEQENPGNRLGVEYVEVEHPSSLLRAGLVLIDTPGIGSTLRHNTEATLRFLPQCDAALFVVSADPPITEVEKDFLKAVRDKVAKLIFVMNKIDYLDDHELDEATRFLERALREADVQDGRTIFGISARQALEAKIGREAALWRKSGLEGLFRHLLDFTAREKSRTLRLALARKALAVIADVSMEIRLRLRSLELSRRELERRVELFDRKVKEIEGEAIKIADLLEGDRKRAVAHVEDLAEKLRRDARSHLERVIHDAFRTAGNLGALERRARAELAEEIPIFFQTSLRWFSDQMEQALRQSLSAHEERLDALTGSLRSAAAALFEIPYRPVRNQVALGRSHRPYWVTEKWDNTIRLLPEGFFDRLLPRSVRRRRIQKRLFDELERLVAHNVENIRWSTLRNLDDAFRRFSAALEDEIKVTAAATREAMRAADLRKTQEEKTARPDIERLERKAGELADIQDAFARCAESA